MTFVPIDPDDQLLIDAAWDVLRKNYHRDRHSVGAAVLCPDGRIYRGVNVEACGYGPCAEPIAIGAAISNGERQFLSIVAVHLDDAQDAGYRVLSPCGNCRQLLIDYAPDAMVIFADDGKVLKTAARNLLPGAYRSNW